MSKGTRIIEFDFIFGGVVTLSCEGNIRFGKVQSVKCEFAGERFDTQGILLDWGDDILPMDEVLKHHAAQFSKDEDLALDEEIVFIPTFNHDEE